DRSRRGLREPEGRSHHRRVARHAAVRRVEGLGHQRQGRRRAPLRPAVPARAEPDGYRGLGARVDTERQLLRQTEDELNALAREPAGGPSRAELEAMTAPRLVTEIPGPRARAVIEADHKVTSPSLPRAYPFAPARGAGSMLEDVDGNVFLDFNAGVAVCSTGHAHPAVVSAIQRQAERLLHYSGGDFYLGVYSEVCAELDRLTSVDGPARTFLTNSGTEAVEAAIKLARNSTGRQYLIAFIGGFHGRSD